MEHPRIFAAILIGVTVIYIVVMIILIRYFRRSMKRYGERLRELEAAQKEKEPIEKEKVTDRKAQQETQETSPDLPQ